jgi:hypothetical protein
MRLAGRFGGPPLFGYQRRPKPGSVGRSELPPHFFSLFSYLLPETVHESPQIGFHLASHLRVAEGKLSQHLPRFLCQILHEAPSGLT